MIFITLPQEFCSYSGSASATRLFNNRQRSIFYDAQFIALPQKVCRTSGFANMRVSIGMRKKYLRVSTP